MSAWTRVERSSWRTGSRCVLIAKHLCPVRARCADRITSPQLNVKLRAQSKDALLPSKKGKVTVHGSNANVSHTINEDERAEFTNHINAVSMCSHLHGCRHTSAV